MTNNNFDIREWRMQQALKEFNELSNKQKKIASAAEPKDKITGDDFKALRTAKKAMKEDSFYDDPTGPEVAFDANHLEEDDWTISTPFAVISVRGSTSIPGSFQTVL